MENERDLEQRSLNPEFECFQKDFDLKLQLAKEQLRLCGATSFGYDVTSGFALEVDLGDEPFSSVAYGDEGSRIWHSKDNPMIVSMLCCSVGDVPYPEIKFHASSEKYKNELMRLGGIFGGDLRDIFDKLEAKIIIDLFE